MKKVTFLLALTACVTFGAQAQKQMGGEHNIEVAFTPFGDAPIDGTVIKYRNFMDETRAFRLSFLLNNTLDTDVLAQEGDLSSENPISPQLLGYTGSTSFGIAPGLEWHWDGTDRVSPYFGLEAYVLAGNDTYEEEFWSANDINQIGNLEKNVLWSVKEKQGYNAFGLNLVTGADFYFTDAMYLGFEAGFGFGKMNVTDYTQEISDLVAYNLYGNPNPTPEDAAADAPVAIVGDVDTGHLGMREIGNNYQASLRVGFLIR
jgi:hypothetical protein